MKHLNNENGSALVLALLVMMVLTVMSMVAVKTSTLGMNRTATYKNYQQNLYLADGGADYGFSIIERTRTADDGQTNFNEIKAVDLANVCGAIPGLCQNAIDLGKEIEGNKTLGAADNADAATRDAAIAIAGESMNIDIDYVGPIDLPGSATEFHSGYEGIGGGGGGGMGLVYKVDSNYVPPSGKQSTVQINFICIEGGGRCL